MGITAEYNPFHNGHLYHLEESRRQSGAEIVVCAMSGDFVQRGAPAIADKWARARMAVLGGADLVVEIPTVFACNAAPVFAASAVEILEELGADYISFGSEAGNIAAICEIAREIAAQEETLAESIRRKVKEGLSFPRARAEAVAERLGEEASALLDTPNNILALEYIKCMRRAKPLTIARLGPGYSELNAEGSLASATAIRRMLREGESIDALVPQPTEKLLAAEPRPDSERLFALLCMQVFARSAAELDRVCAGGEGLGNKLKNEIRRAASWDELVEILKSKRYTRTRIERFLMHVLLDIAAPEKYTNFIRPLAFNSRGSAYLKAVKKSGLCRLPFVSSIKRTPAEPPAETAKETSAETAKEPPVEGRASAALAAAIEKEILAADIYNLICGRDLYEFSEFVRSPRLV